MLSGTLPYEIKGSNTDNDGDSDNDETEKKNNFDLQNSIIHKNPKPIENISDEARDLLNKILNKNPKQRLNCDQIL